MLSPATPPPFNRCNLSPWAIASLEFQARPQPLEIAGVRQADQRLFSRLASVPDAGERGRIFHDYLSVKFRLHEWAEHRGTARSSIRSSYLQFLRNWGADSNGHAGAVLKSWVEGRFGLPATFHGAPLATDADARDRYARDRMCGAAKTVGALMQLDLLYTFCQDELARRFPDTLWRTLYRGTHDPDEYLARDEAANSPSLGARPHAMEHAARTGGARASSGGRGAADPVVRLNNLSSFTADREIAWEFGSSVWEVQVPLPKIVFFSGLLPRHLLEGEAEFLVLGGDYRVSPLLY